MTLFRSISAAVIIGLMMLACTQKELQLADQVAYEIAILDRCTKFATAKSKAHQRLRDLPPADLDRLQEINRIGGTICRESIDDLTAEVEAMVRRLP